MTLRLQYDKRAPAAGLGVFFGGVISIIIYSLNRHDGRPGPDADMTVEMWLLILVVAFAFIVYRVRVHVVRERSPKLVVEDLLRMCAISLGGIYRLHIMTLRPGHDPVIPFGFVAVYNMQNLQEIEEKLKRDTPGVGSAFAAPQNIIVLGPDEMDRTIDPYVQHIWSGKIVGTNSVLTIDSTDSVSATQVPHVREIVASFRVILKKYKVETLGFLY